MVLQGSDDKHQYTIECQFCANLVAFTTYLTIGLVIDSLASTLSLFLDLSPLLYRSVSWDLSFVLVYAPVTSSVSSQEC